MTVDVCGRADFLTTSNSYLEPVITAASPSARAANRMGDAPGNVEGTVDGDYFQSPLKIINTVATVEGVRRECGRFGRRSVWQTQYEAETSIQTYLY